MRSLFAALLLLPGTIPAFTQDAHRSEVALGYTYVHTNAPPGDCGCISLHGGGGSFAWLVKPQFAIVADLGAVHSGDAASSGLDLTLTSYLFGPRVLYQTKKTRIVPFAQALLGATHATGTLAPANSNGGSSSTVFAATLGGGIDIPIKHHIAVRPAQVEYFVTTLPNSITSHQNNLRVSSGIVLRFGK